MEIFIIILLVVIIVYIIRKKQYEKTDYYCQTHNSFNNKLTDKGKLGEYYTYKNLSGLTDTSGFYSIYIFPKATAKRPNWTLFFCMNREYM